MNITLFTAHMHFEHYIVIVILFLESISHGTYMHNSVSLLLCLQTIKCFSVDCFFIKLVTVVRKLHCTTGPKSSADQVESLNAVASVQELNQLWHHLWYGNRFLHPLGLLPTTFLVTNQCKYSYREGYL